MTKSGFLQGSRNLLFPEAMAYSANCMCLDFLISFDTLRCCMGVRPVYFRGKILPVSVVYLERASLSKNVYFSGFRLLAGWVSSCDIQNEIYVFFEVCNANWSSIVRSIAGLNSSLTRDQRKRILFRYESCFLHQNSQEQTPRLQGCPQARQIICDQQNQPSLQGETRVRIIL